MGDDSALWMPLLEKAFAKYYGNYERIAGGNPMKAVRALNGSPFDSYMHIRGDSSKKNEIWNAMVTLNNENSFIMAGSPGTDDSQKNDEGIVLGHAYTV